MEILGRSIGLVLLSLVLAFPATAQNLQLAEQKIKAGMLYNFLKYTDWPAATTSENIVVCLFGADSLAGNLQAMQGRSVNQRSIVIRSLQEPAEAASCQLLVLGEDKKESWPQLHKLLAGKPVLTVSDYASFAESGGMITFGHDAGRITVALNSDAVAAAQLSVQPRLRNLMTPVRSSP